MGPYPDYYIENLGKIFRAGEVIKLGKLCGDLGIPEVSSAKEFKKLNPDSTVMIVTENIDWLKWILSQKLENSDRKTILVLEFDSFVKTEPKQLEEELEFFKELQQKYPDRFEFKSIDVRSVLKEYLASKKSIGVRLKSEEAEQQEESADTILRLFKKYGDYNLVVYLSVDIYVDLFTKLKESRNNEEINNIINKIAVFVPYEERREAEHMLFVEAYRYDDMRYNDMKIKRTRW